MKTISKPLLSVIFTLLLNSGVFAQMVSIDEATIIAKNWIEIIKDEKGGWGVHQTARIEPLQDFEKNGRKLGYFCHVKPEGYIILSLRRELAPVKAYSPKGYFDPSEESTGADIIKTTMGMILDTIESEFGPLENVQMNFLAPFLEINYCAAWEALYNYTPGALHKGRSNLINTRNYQEGEIMLEGNNWHQYPPYNEYCPYLACTATSNGRAFVGCVATAGSQIMYHWCWPPYGVSPYNDTYDWPNMADVVTGSSPQATINAVAELGYEVGLCVDMDFGCDGSGATMYLMEGVFEGYYRYSSISNTIWRSNYTAYDWFEAFKDQMNLNRPVEYGISGHAIVGDGWQEIGSPVVKQFHMNWGWTGTSNDAWYTLDAVPNGGFYIEHFIRDIVPTTFLGTNLSGTYAPLSIPRYFDRDASGSNATFNSGHQLQILPDLTITGIGTSTYIKFFGATGLYTNIYTKGDNSEGILIKNGGIRLINNGSIKLN